jgi:hypothetical protein
MLALLSPGVRTMRMRPAAGAGPPAGSGEHMTTQPVAVAEVAGTAV